MRRSTRGLLSTGFSEMVTTWFGTNRCFGIDLYDKLFFKIHPHIRKPKLVYHGNDAPVTRGRIATVSLNRNEELRPHRICIDNGEVIQIKGLYARCKAYGDRDGIDSAARYSLKNNPLPGYIPDRLQQYSFLENAPACPRRRSVFADTTG